MFDRHPIAVWSSIVLTVMLMAVGLVWTQLEEISERQAEILRSQAVHGQRLLTIEDDLQDSIQAADVRFSMRADEHRWLGSEIGRVSTEVGRIVRLHAPAGPHGRH